MNDVQPTEAEQKVLEEAQKTADQLEATRRAEMEAKKKKVVEQAAKIVAIMDTEGYKAIIEFLEEEKKAYETRADQLIIQNPQTQALEVNPILVSHIGSTYMAFEAILNGFKNMKKLIEREAAKNQAESK